VSIARARIALARRIALSAPVRWAYRWHRRVEFAEAAAELDRSALEWADVRPFHPQAAEIDRSISSATSAEIFDAEHTFPAIVSGLVPLADRVRPDRCPTPASCAADECCIHHCQRQH